MRDPDPNLTRANGIDASQRHRPLAHTTGHWACQQANKGKMEFLHPAMLTLSGSPHVASPIRDRIQQQEC